MEVYSQIGIGIQFYYNSTVDSGYNPPVKIKDGMDGGWFKVTYMNGDGYKYQTRICIEVGENDTGKERTIPVAVVSYNYPSHVLYKQAK